MTLIDTDPLGWVADPEIHKELLLEVALEQTGAAYAAYSMAHERTRWWKWFAVTLMGVVVPILIFAYFLGLNANRNAAGVIKATGEQSAAQQAQIDENRRVIAANVTRIRQLEEAVQHVTSTTTTTTPRRPGRSTPPSTAPVASAPTTTPPAPPVTFDPAPARTPPPPAEASHILCIGSLCIG